jgi:hypothetical protein
MFEVVVTFRVDFSEYSLGRYPTCDEAQERARQVSVQNYDKILRAWVRVVREAKAQS